MTARTRPTGAEGLAAAALALRAGELVVLPTDTVYGVGADAFNPAAVTCLLVAKGRGRDMPPPVLVGTVRAATALVEDLGPYGQQLIDEFWPGGLTIVCRAQPVAELGPGRHPRDGGGPDAAAPGRARPAQGDRAAGGQQRQPHRRAGRDHRRGRARSSSATPCRCTWTAARA